MFGSLFVSQFPKNSRLFQVILQAEADYRSRPEDLDKVYVRNRNGEMVPIKAVTTSRYVPGADIMTRFNNFPAAKIMGDAAPGYSSGQALAAMEDVAREVLGQGYSFAWSGQAYEEKTAGSTAAMVFAFALLMVFLILAAQYENGRCHSVSCWRYRSRCSVHWLPSCCAACRTTSTSRSG